MRTWETTPNKFIFSSILNWLWIHISWLFSHSAFRFFVGLVFPIPSFSKAWNNAGDMICSPPISSDQLILDIQLVLSVPTKRMDLPFPHSVYQRIPWIWRFSLLLQTHRIFRIPQTIFFCFISTEAQCTAVNMLLNFRCHWPHLLSF